MTHPDRIKQMAQEAGVAWIDVGGLPRPSIIDYADLTPNLARFAQLVAEDCARVCAAMLGGCHDRSEYDAYSPDDAQTIGWVDALNESQKRIRARYSPKD